MIAETKTVRAKADLLFHRFGADYHGMLQLFSKARLDKVQYDRTRPVAEQLDKHEELFTLAINDMYKHYFNNDLSWLTLVN